jgi:hypothetical protein
MEPDVVMQAHNPSTWETEAGGSQDWSQSGLYTKILSHKNIDQREKKARKDKKSVEKQNKREIPW